MKKFREEVQYQDSYHLGEMDARVAHMQRRQQQDQEELRQRFDRMEAGLCG